MSTGRGKPAATTPQKLCFSPQCVFIEALSLQQVGCGQQMCLSVFTEFLVAVTPHWMYQCSFAQHIPVNSSCRCTHTGLAMLFQPLLPQAERLEQMHHFLARPGIPFFFFTLSLCAIVPLRFDSSCNKMGSLNFLVLAFPTRELILDNQNSSSLLLLLLLCHPTVQIPD